MPHVEGRGIRQPTVGDVFMGDLLVLRIDDKKNPIFWLTLTFTVEEFGALFDKWADWLHQSGQRDALMALMEKR